jgi:hypothetical protein
VFGYVAINGTKRIIQQGDVRSKVGGSSEVDASLEIKSVSEIIPICSILVAPFGHLYIAGDQ